MEKIIQKTWDYIWDRLYDDRTGMFYNHLAGDDANATKYLPEPEMIRLLIPNPAGYGTGMEDCMLNAGLMMDAVIARYEATGDASMREYAAKICKGLILGASVSRKKGFLPRGVSPADCSSHYIDTSRDQYTDWLWAAYRLYYSPLADEAQKDGLRRCIILMAEKFEAEVIAENDWNFLREDGKIGVAGKMWGDINPHEFLRLPMLYLLAWKTTGNDHWHKKYIEYRDIAVQKSMEYIPLSGPTYAALQMQYSMRVVYDLDDDEYVRASLLNMMEKLADPYECLSIKEATNIMTPEGKQWLEIPYSVWQKSKHRFAGVWGGIGYFVPEPSDFREHQSYYPLRAVGEGIVIAATCPNRRISKAALTQLCNVIDFVDYEKHRTCAPIALLEAYWLAMRSDQLK